LPVSKLSFDPLNYRLPEEIQGAGQDEMLQYLDRYFDVEKIAQSIADNGYFPEEPLVAIPDGPDSWIVVEGNRRLAALKMLTDKSFRKFCTHQGFWSALDKVRNRGSIDHVPVLIYSNRDELQTFLGQRHIAGIVKWDPLSKARFITALIERQQKEGHLDLDKLAAETGADKNELLDNFAAYKAFLQARDKFSIDTSNLEKEFSVFGRALTYGNIARYLELPRAKNVEKLEEPIKESNRDKLQNLVELVHGTKTVKSVITDSRMLKQLGDVLANEEAREELESNRDLERAYELTEKDESVLLKDIRKTSRLLERINSIAFKYAENEEVIDELVKTAQLFNEIAKHFPEVKKELEAQR